MSVNAAAATRNFFIGISVELIRIATTARGERTFLRTKRINSNHNRASQMIETGRANAAGFDFSSSGRFRKETNRRSFTWRRWFSSPALVFRQPGHATGCFAWQCETALDRSDGRTRRHHSPWEYSAKLLNRGRQRFSGPVQARE
jgi:hypothetical protein